MLSRGYTKRISDNGHPRRILTGLGKMTGYIVKRIHAVFIVLGYPVLGVSLSQEWPYLPATGCCEAIKAQQTVITLPNKDYG